ncbi:MAG: YjbF family lipoprotein [Idiomarina sp.]
MFTYFPSLKYVLAALALVALNGCNSGFQDALETTKRVFVLPEGITLTPAEISELSYAASYIQLQDKPRAVMVLNFDDNSLLSWAAGPHEVIATRYGRLVFTRNILGGPEFVSNLQADPIACVRKTLREDDGENKQLANCPNTWARNMEVGSPIQNNNQRLKITGRFDFQSMTKQSIILPNESTYETLKLTEALTVQPGNIRVENTFWLEIETGRVLKSRQWFSPDLGFITTEEVKAYVGDM